MIVKPSTWKQSGSGAKETYFLNLVLSLEAKRSMVGEIECSLHTVLNTLESSSHSVFSFKTLEAKLASELRWPCKCEIESHEPIDTAKFHKSWEILLYNLKKKNNFCYIIFKKYRYISPLVILYSCTILWLLFVECWSQCVITRPDSTSIRTKYDRLKSCWSHWRDSYWMEWSSRYYYMLYYGKRK